MGSVSLAYVVQKLAKVWNIDFRKCCEIKQTVTFESLVE